MKRILALLWVFALIIGLVACAGQSEADVYEPEAAESPASIAEQTGFHSPECAVLAYLEGLRDSDVARMAGALPDNLPDGIYAEEVIDSFIANLNFLLDEFQSLEVLGFIPPEVLDERYASDANQTNLSNQAERLGVDQMVSRVVVFELGGEKHILIVDVADFGGEWRISQFGGNLGALLFIAPFMQGIIPSEFVDEFLGEIDLDALMTSP